MTVNKEIEAPAALHKTLFTEAQAQQFLQEHYGLSDVYVEMLKGGESSQAFRFSSAEGDRVLRVNRHSQEGFLKDRLAASEYGNAALPIPQILQVGQLDADTYFAVSEAMPGVDMYRLKAHQVELLMPHIGTVLNEIHSAQPLGEGYGSWDGSGKGRFSSWRESLTERTKLVESAEMPGFVDLEAHKKAESLFLNLLEFCPEERRVIHADFGFDNLLVEDGKITGVIDWEMSAYGDPLYDIAWLGFWGGGHGFL